jgi:excisionase family DNA binding protein
MKLHTTKEAAEKLGVHRVTLQNWVAEGKIPAPATRNIGGGLVRLWSQKDIQKARKAIAKLGE